MINFKQHTIVCMVGPSGSGKSYLCDKIQAQFHDRKVSIVRSDDLRREMLCDNSLSEIDSVMMTVSSQAFDLLYTKIDLYSSYPVNHDLILVDTTGLNAQFRDKIREIANKNNYNFDVIVMEYKDVNDYYVHAKAEWLTRKHVRSLQKSELANIGRCGQKIKIRDLNFDSLVFTLDDHGNYIDGNCLVVGDLHGCYQEFLSLLTKAGVEVENNSITNMNGYDHIVLVGDYVDKGPLDQQYLLISFIHNNLDKIKVVRGNHENFVIKYWDGGIDVDDSVLVNFNSARHECVNFRQKTREIYDQSYDFLVHPKFIVTHSPCKKNQLGKTNPSDLKAQRNFRHSRFTQEELIKELKFLDEGERCFPLHIFGHLACNRIYGGRNWKCIDTGAVSGGFLTALSFKDKVQTFSVKGNSNDPRPLLSLQLDKSYSMSDIKKDKFKKRLVNQIIRNNIGFISGTMSPAEAIKD